MGAWGIGLYSNDFARDLRASVGAVARLPFPPETLLGHLRAAEPGAADNPANEDHSLFWLSVADQFAKRGIDCLEARERALAIIADGSDLKMMAALGMDERSLRKRGAMLDALAERLAAPVDTARRRGVLRGPQKLLLEIGEVLTYPLCQGRPINPYTVGKDWEWVKAWRQDGWGGAVVVARGLAFDHLAWYRAVVVAEPLASEPSLSVLAEPRLWIVRSPGTLTARHAANLQLKSLGQIAIDPDRLAHFAPAVSGVSSAVNDISIANTLNSEPRLHPVLPRRIHALSDIADGPLLPAARGPEVPLSGRWRGEFGYQRVRRPPVTFAATLSEVDGRVSGEITEGADGRTASASGRRLGWLVKFDKRYEGRPVAVEYEGEIDAAASSISGRWSIPGNVSGDFTMTRA